MFLLGHRKLRSRGLRSRGAYAAIGALAMLPAFALAMGWPAIADAGRTGSLSALLICPLIGGALMGFLYHRRAGYETEGDDVEALAASAASPTAPVILAHVATDTAEYFAGPLVVRTSPAANALASLLASSVFVLAQTLSARLEPFQSPLGEYMAHNGPARSMLQGIIGTALPIALLLALTHGYLRSRGKHKVAEYALAGLIGPAIFSALIATTGMSWLSFVYFAQYLAPSLVALLAYRRLAGLEPAPLPDDIEVSDRRTLVGEDHIRRRMARVIDTAAR